MPNVKVIDAAAWAALPEISVEENEDLAGKGIPSDTYRCIRSDVASAVVTQLTGVGAESASEVGSPSEVAAGLPSGLVAQWEMDNTTVTASSWVDEVGGLNLVSSGYDGDPTITSGGTPSGMDLYDFGTATVTGLGVDVSSSSLPSGNSNRTMALVIGWKSGEPNYQGVMYGDNATKEAFGITAFPNGHPAADFWASSVEGSVDMDGTGLHVLIARYDGTNAILYVDGSQDGTGAVGPLNTTLDTLRAVNSLSGAASNGVELAAILIWDNDVGASGVSDIQTYLNNKYLVA